MTDVRFDDGALEDLFRSDPVAQDLARRAIRVESEAKRRAPVLTGRLRSSISHAPGQDGRGLYVDIGTNVAYARFVEFGTTRQRPRPYLRPALNAAR